MTIPKQKNTENQEDLHAVQVWDLDLDVMVDDGEMMIPPGVWFEIARQYKSLLEDYVIDKANKLYAFENPD